MYRLVVKTQRDLACGLWEVATHQVPNIVSSETALTIATGRVNAAEAAGYYVVSVEVLPMVEGEA